MTDLDPTDLDPAVAGAGDADLRTARPTGSAAGPADERQETWTFLTNHSHVLICLARDPRTRIRDLAAMVGITERAVQGILNDLESAGCIVRHREGRRNRYEVRPDRPMRHPVERGHVVGEIIDVLGPTADVGD